MIRENYYVDRSHMVRIISHFEYVPSIVRLFTFLDSEFITVIINLHIGAIH